MKSILSISAAEHKEYEDTYSSILSKIEGHDIRDLISYDTSQRYGHYVFDGKYTDKLIELLGHEPTEDDIIMIVDKGFHSFGAYCRIWRDKKEFSGRVNID